METHLPLLASWLNDSASGLCRCLQIRADENCRVWGGLGYHVPKPVEIALSLSGGSVREKAESPKLQL